MHFCSRFVFWSISECFSHWVCESLQPSVGRTASVLCVADQACSQQFRAGNFVRIIPFPTESAERGQAGCD